MTFEQALLKTGHRDEFIQRATEGATQSELFAWMRTLPDLVAICDFPIGLKALRQKMGCPAPAGGKRNGRSRSPLIVRNGRAI